MAECRCHQFQAVRPVMRRIYSYIYGGMSFTHRHYLPLVHDGAPASRSAPEDHPSGMLRGRLKFA